MAPPLPYGWCCFPYASLGWYRFCFLGAAFPSNYFSWCCFLTSFWVAMSSLLGWRCLHLLIFLGGVSVLRCAVFLPLSFSVVLPYFLEKQHHLPKERKKSNATQQEERKLLFHKKMTKSERANAKNHEIQKGKTCFALWTF